MPANHNSLPAGDCRQVLQHVFVKLYVEQFLNPVFHTLTVHSLRMDFSANHAFSKLFVCFRLNNEKIKFTVTESRCVYYVQLCILMHLYNNEILCGECDGACIVYKPVCGQLIFGLDKSRNGRFMDGLVRGVQILHYQITSKAPEITTRAVIKSWLFRCILTKHLHELTGQQIVQSTSCPVFHVTSSLIN